MGGGPKERPKERGAGDGEEGGWLSYQPCRIVVHLILLSSGLGGAFAFGDNRHLTPERGFELVKLSFLLVFAGWLLVSKQGDRLRCPVFI